MTAERALVTGISGFLGSHLARQLVDDGTAVHALVRPGARLDRVLDLVDRVELHVDDGHAETVAAVVREVAPVDTYHLATHFVAEHAVTDVDALIEANVAFGTRLADALAYASPGARFVNVGTAWQHVSGARYRPKNLYAATKQAFEDVLNAYTEREQLAVVTVNLFDTYGPRDHRGKLVSALVRAARAGERLAMSSGTQLVDLLYVDDAVRALRAAREHASIGAPGSFAASSAHPLTIREVVDALARVTGTDVPVEWGSRPDRPGEMREPWDAGPPVPGWVPQVSLAEGLAVLWAEAHASGAPEAPV